MSMLAGIMTDENKERAKRLMFDESLKWLISIFLFALGALVLAMFTPWWDNARAVWNTPARMEEGFTSVIETQQQLREEIAQLQTAMLRVTGADRVIRQPEGLSYIEEPVYRWEHVYMVLVVGRTDLGASCQLQDWLPLFTDQTGITYPGRHYDATGQSGVTRQIGTDTTRLRVEMIPPDLRPNGTQQRIMEPGRVEVYLALRYDCDGQTINERTAVLTYQMIEGERPE